MIRQSYPSYTNAQHAVVADLISTQSTIEPQGISSMEAIWDTWDTFMA